jgi:type II secretory pathway pseudopilin PulG
MIELIFAIVIIGITVVSLPMMTQATNKGMENSIVQEAVFAAAAELNEVVTYHWDGNSLEPGSTDSLAKVIQTTNTDCENNASLSTYRLRPGHIVQPLHRRCLDSNATRPTADANLGPDSIFDDIDDPIGPKAMYINNASGGAGVFDSTGYKEEYNSTISVEYAGFGSTAQSEHNMKKITVEIKKGSDTITRLVTYSANIGEIDYYKRSY